MNALRSARWIGPYESVVPPAGERPAYVLRGTFSLPSAGSSTFVYATAHGIYELFVNGARVGDQELTPGFSSYRARLAVDSFDVTDLVVAGENAVCLVLSDGWFRGRHGFERRADGFGTRTAALVAVVAEGEPGPVLVTDGTWLSRRSHIWRADLMDGQGEDLRELDPRWFLAGPPGEGWHPVDEVVDELTADCGRLVLAEGPPVVRMEEMTPSSLSAPRPGTVVIDLGQEINGWLRLPEIGPSGTHLTITHGEIVDASGLVDTDHLRAFNFATRSLLPAGQIDEVISAGRPGEGFEPRHTTHGFRYAQVDGIPDALDLSGARGVVVHSDIPRTGDFSCSDPRLERLHEVVRWSLRTNACAIPTDCPQRERSGFTGDWQVFVGTATLMADVSAFSRRWLRDLAADQWDDGRVPTVIPNPSGNHPSGVAFEDMSAGSAGWGDAAALVPWELWRAYGDREALAEQYPAMCRWVDYAAGCAATRRHPDRTAARPVAAAHEQYLWDTGFHFGEWLEPGEVPHPDPSVDHGIVATAFLHRSALVASRTASILGDTDSAERFAVLAEGARTAWRAEYLLPNGHLSEEKQAHYVRALAFDLVPEALRSASADRLVELIEAAGWRLGTGFLATRDLLPVLADTGHADVAYKLLTATGHPSWLGMLEAGATTMWEWWDGAAVGGSVHGSLNHYSKGAVASFLHTHVAGLRLPEFPDAEEAGYRTVSIHPVPGPGLSSASTRQQTHAGTIDVSWRIDGAEFVLDAHLPAATTAKVELPDGTETVLSGAAHVVLSCPAASVGASQPPISRSSHV